MTESARRVSAGGDPRTPGGATSVYDHLHNYTYSSLRQKKTDHTPTRNKSSTPSSNRWPHRSPAVSSRSSSVPRSRTGGNRRDDSDHSIASHSTHGAQSSNVSRESGFAVDSELLADMGMDDLPQETWTKEELLQILKDKKFNLLSRVLHHEKAKARAEIDVRAREDQIRTLKRTNQQLQTRLRKEEEMRMQSHQERMSLEETTRYLGEENTKLVEKVQVVEDAKAKSAEDVRTKEEQLRVLSEQNFQLLNMLYNEEEAGSKIQEDVKKKDAHIASLQDKLSQVELNLEKEKEARAKIAAELKSMEQKVLDASNFSSDLQKKVDSESYARSKEEARLKEELKNKDEQLRILRKKNSQMMSKMQLQEQAKKKAIDDSGNIEERLRVLRRKNTTLMQKLQHEEEEKIKAMEESRAKDEQLRLLVEINSFLGVVGAPSKKDITAVIQDKDNRIESLERDNESLRERLAEWQSSQRASELAMGADTHQIAALQEERDRYAQQLKEEEWRRVEVENALYEKENEMRAVTSQVSSLFGRTEEKARQRYSPSSPPKGDDSMLSNPNRLPLSPKSPSDMNTSKGSPIVASTSFTSPPTSANRVFSNNNNTKSPSGVNPVLQAIRAEINAVKSPLNTSSGGVAATTPPPKYEGSPARSPTTRVYVEDSPKRQTPSQPRHGEHVLNRGIFDTLVQLQTEKEEVLRGHGNDKEARLKELSDQICELLAKLRSEEEAKQRAAP